MFKLFKIAPGIIFFQVLLAFYTAVVLIQAVKVYIKINSFPEQMFFFFPLETLMPSLNMLH